MSDGIIVVAGEALFDLVDDGTGALLPHAGGGPFNTARTIARLERPVAFLGRLSLDRFGEKIAGMLAGDGVRLDTVERTKDPTTLALAEIDPDRGARYRFYDRGTAAPGLTADAALQLLPARLGYLHVGTLGLVLEPMASALEAVVERVAGGAVVIVDPNCRPGVIADPDAYRRRLERVLSQSDAVKLSEEDAAWLWPAETPVAAVRGLLERGPRLGVLTRGADGAVVITRDAEIAVQATAAEVIDTIGAGDAFGGAFLAWWQARGLGRSQLDDIETAAAAARFASVVAALTCARSGGTPPYLEEVQRLTQASGEPGLLAGPAGSSNVRTAGVAQATDPAR